MVLRRLIVILLGGAAVMAVAPVAAAAAPQPDVVPVKYLQPGWCDLDWEQFPYPSPLYPNGYEQHHYYKTCAQPRKKRLSYTQSGTVEGCMGGGVSYLGPRWSPGTTNFFLYDNYIGATDLGLCQTDTPAIQLPSFPPPRNGELPVVTVNGTVTTENPRLPQEQARPLSEARAELWYYGRAGNYEDPLQWRPVVDRAATPAPVRLHLNGQGQYSATFIYPQDLPGPPSSGPPDPPGQGLHWHGCLQDQAPVAFMRSYACGHEWLELRIYAENAAGSVSVRGTDGATSLIGTVPIGHFFQQPGNTVNAVLDSSAAQAYRAPYNMRAALPPLPGGFPPVHIVLDPAVHGIYSPWLRTIRINPEATYWSTMEHEIGHAVMHHLYGADYPGFGSNCPEHYWTTPSNPQCAMDEGISYLLAAITEAELGLAAGEVRYDAKERGSIEYCGVHRDHGNYQSFIECSPGPLVEGRVAGAVGDLIDAEKDAVGSAARSGDSG